jgi:hypothetical protein
MSTVPAPLAGELLLLAGELLLLLLLQPAAAKAIAARAAIAVVRLIIFIFLSLIGIPAAVKQAGWPASGFSPCGGRGMDDVTKSSCGGRTGLGVDSCQCPEWGEHYREHLGRRFAASGETRPRAADRGRAVASMASSLRSGRPGIGRACQSPVSWTLTVGNEAIKGRRRAPQKGT